mmetsp:Transcript_19365/g.52106  ORF Transcript_19365/g.52106 Transcript_19365/m.52106 type:complete len:212 (-) Transcript_19365:1333-1968(-)
MQRCAEPLSVWHVSGSVTQSGRSAAGTKRSDCAAAPSPGVARSKAGEGTARSSSSASSCLEATRAHSGEVAESEPRRERQLPPPCASEAGPLPRREGPARKAPAREGLRETSRTCVSSASSTSSRSTVMEGARARPRAVDGSVSPEERWRLMTMSAAVAVAAMTVLIGDDASLPRRLPLCVGDPRCWGSKPPSPPSCESEGPPPPPAVSSH